MAVSNLYSAVQTGRPDDALVKVVVPGLRLIWLWIPKNAGGSISRTLVRVHGEDAIPLDLPFNRLWRLNPELKTFKVTAFKRNPFTRAVSCWLNKIAYAPGFNPRFLRKYPGLRPEMPFQEFAEWLTTPEADDSRADNHWISQHLLLERATEVLAFEELPGAISSLGIAPDQLPHRNSHNQATAAAGLDDRPLLEWYDARAFAHVRQRYAEDLVRLGYDAPDELLALVGAAAA